MPYEARVQEPLDAAHERNVELGVRIDDAALASTIEDEIDRLIAGGVLVPLG